MHRRTFLGALAGFAATACTRKAQSEPQSRGGTARISDGDFLSLVYWDAGSSWPAEPSERQFAIVDDVLRSRDERYLAYLLDLATVPNPYAGRVVDGLRDWLGDFGPSTRRWFDNLGARVPSDDTNDYLRFKRVLYSTVQADYGGFLDASLARSISAQEVRWGGVGVDGIPPLESPAFVDVAGARRWALDSDQVIGIELNGETRCYPRRIIDWHEMVNDTVGGIPVSLAYCTLCNSAILYDGRVGNRVFRFGTSGLLHRSNKLMFDRTSRTLWGQYSGHPVWGSLASDDIQLRYLPAVHTEFGEWVARHPDTSVLDIDTSFARDYGPGVAYADYWASPDLMFPVAIATGNIDPKAPVFTVRLEGETVAYPLALLAQRGFIADIVSGRQIVVLSTADGSGGRAYETGDVAILSWDPASGEAGSAGRRWDMTEDALVSDGEALPRLPGHNSFWFAVANHTEGGRLYEP